MPLVSGTRLGPYEILSPLGAGGMGEVYRARDTRLDRTVAIKILPSHLSDNPEARQRFDREARAISSLNHPNICTLYDVGHQDGVDYLVMEYLEGETLADRVRKGPLPPEQVLKYGTEICEGLEKAHRSGVVHRDLKPGNIMLTKAGAKLMDFGLAKAVSAGSPPSSGLTATLLTPEVSQPLTAQGTVVGTFQYMAPEQVEGREADVRSDIFALGAVLYEMATGRAAFSGKTQASVVAAILASEPAPVSTIQPMSPPALDRVIKTCLAKDPEERLQTVHDVKLQLRWIAEAGSQAGVPVPVAARRRWDRAGWIVATALLLLLASSGALWWKLSSPPARPMYFHAAVPFAAHDLALSPNGRTLAMVAYSAEANNYMLWTSDLGGRRTTLLDGTQGASYPFWSPDGASIGFFADGKLKKIDAAGGQPQVLCDAPNGRGATWNRDGVILFAPDALGGLWRVSSWGGTPVEVTKPDASRSESNHRWPVFLPDGKHFAYLAANFSGKPGINAIFVGSLDSSEKHFLVNASANAAYAEPGYLLYLRDRTLVAQQLDLRHNVLIGEPRTVSDEVLYFPQVYRAVFGVSRGDVLVTQTGKGVYLSQLTWFDRGGKPVGTIGKPAWYSNVQLSPDGRKVATDQTDPDGRNVDVWVLDPARDSSTRLTFDPALDMTPVWSPDSKRLLISSNRTLDFRLYTKNADGSGSDEEIIEAGGPKLDTQFNALDWSHDAQDILIRRDNGLAYFAWRERMIKPLLETSWVVRGAQFSPDSRWIAYASNETGRMEIYVCPFPGGKGKWQVSTAGGQEVRWRRDGKEMFYLSPDGTMMSVTVTLGTSFEASSPVALFQTHRRQTISSQDLFSYDVSQDGQRFLIVTKMEEGTAAPLSVRMNWSAEMEKK